MENSGMILSPRGYPCWMRWDQFHSGELAIILHSYGVVKVVQVNMGRTALATLNVHERGASFHTAGYDQREAVLKLVEEIYASMTNMVEMIDEEQ